MFYGFILKRRVRRRYLFLGLPNAAIFQHKAIKFSRTDARQKFQCGHPPCGFHSADASQNLIPEQQPSSWVMKLQDFQIYDQEAAAGRGESVKLWWQQLKCKHYEIESAAKSPMFYRNNGHVGCHILAPLHRPLEMRSRLVAMTA